MLFSVLIANYNGEKYLRECLNSVVSQSYSNWECIIVDDGSIDHSKNIIEEFVSDNRIKVFYRSKNKGATYTKKECIEYAQGDICGYLDSDDMLAPYAIEAMIQAHEDKNVSIVSSRYYKINENGDIIGSNRLLKLPREGGGYLEGRDYTPEHFVAFKKKAYTQTKGLDINHKIGDDQELYLLLEEVGRWVVLDKYLYYYRVHSQSISKTKTFECYY